MTSPGVPIAPRRPAVFRLAPLFLFLLSFGVYNANFRRVGAYDSLPASLIPMSVLSGDGFTLDRYASLFPPEAAYTTRRSPDGRRKRSRPSARRFKGIPIFPMPIFGSASSGFRSWADATTRSRRRKPSRRCRPP